MEVRVRLVRTSLRRLEILDCIKIDDASVDRSTIGGERPCQGQTLNVLPLVGQNQLDLRTLRLEGDAGVLRTRGLMRRKLGQILKRESQARRRIRERVSRNFPISGQEQIMDAHRDSVRLPALPYVKPLKPHHRFIPADFPLRRVWLELVEALLLTEVFAESVLRRNVLQLLSTIDAKPCGSQKSNGPPSLPRARS